MMKKERYHITGMTCASCSAHVERAVSRQKGVFRVSVNLLAETMEIEYDESILGQKDISDAVEHAGYGAVPLEERNGKDAKSEREKIREEAKRQSDSMRLRLGVSVGFLLVLMYVAMFPMYHEWFGLPIPDFFHRYFHGPENVLVNALTQFLLVLPILYLNRSYFSSGLKALKSLSPNMDSLIAIGVSASVGYGLFVIYQVAYGTGHGDFSAAERYVHDLYFESAGMILTLITVGKYLENRSRRKTGEAIEKLIDLSPKLAVVVGEDGTESVIPAGEVREGDICLIKPGGMIPVDATIVEGAASIDEAAITGESVPAEKQAGDKVISGTLNRNGFLKIRADRVGEDTTLAQMIRLVEEAQAGKVPLAKLADRVAGVFVPVVMGIALLTLFAWLCAGAETEFAISCAIAVLVISCPCALGLATPVAVMVGTGVGAGQGILIKSGEALQRAKEIDTVVLDKTGTITSGKLSVEGVFGYAATPETLLALAAAPERKSEHPLAEAVVNEAQSYGVRIPEIREFHAVFGRGVKGRLEEDFRCEAGAPDGPTATISRGSRGEDQKGHKQGMFAAGTQILVGNQAFLEEHKVEIPKLSLQGIAQAAEEGMTPLLVAAGQEFLGFVGLTDRAKESSVQAIKRLQDMHIRVVMLTGDNKRTAEAVRKKLQIGEAIAEVLPQEKERVVRRLKEEGHVVAMVGDGINDAPALAAADVGMAIGAGTDVAMESADIVLMKSDLRDAVTAIRLSRAVIRNIRQNLFWAFFYNAIGIPLAAGLWYPSLGIKLSPMFGAAAMSMSSIFVVGNALRLRRFRAEKKAAQKTGVVEPQQEQNHEKEDEVMNKVVVKVLVIEGMMCGHCTGRVQKALEGIDGVISVQMSLEEKSATVEMSAEVSDETLTGAVTDAGYEVKEIRA